MTLSITGSPILHLFDRGQTGFDDNPYSQEMRRLHFCSWIGLAVSIIALGAWAVGASTSSLSLMVVVAAGLTTTLMALLAAGRPTKSVAYVQYRAKP